MAPGGDYCRVKDLLTLLCVHPHRFKEMLRITELLPAGDIPKPLDELMLQWYYMLCHKSDRKQFGLSRKMLDDETLESVTTFFQALFEQKKLDGVIELQEADRKNKRLLQKLQRSSTDGFARPPTAGAASMPDARLLFVMINAATLLTKDIGAIVIVLTTIAVGMTATPPKERQSATVANTRLAMGFALATISLESGRPWLAAKKTARARAPRAKCTTIQVAWQSMSGPNTWRTWPVKRSRQ